MSLNSSKLTCWSPLISASWKCQGEFVRGSWFNTCTQININNCKQQKQLQITCTISPSSSSVSSTPSRVRTNLISDVDTIPFPSCIYGDFHWFQNWFIPVSIFPSLLPYFDVLLLSFTLSKTLKACLRSSGVSFSCSLWRRCQYYSHVTLRDVLVEVSFTPPHPSPWSSNQQIRQSPQSQNHRHRRPSGKVGDDCSGVKIEVEVEQTHIYHIIELLLCRVAAWNRNNCHKKSWLHSLFKILLWIQRLQDPPMNSTTSRSSIMNSKTPNDRKTAPNSFVDTVPSPSWWFSKLFCQIYHLYDRNLIKHDENPLESLDIFVWHHNRKLERM